MFNSIRSKFIFLYSLLTISFIVVLLTTIYFTERDKALNIALEKSIEASQLNANLVSSEFKRYVAMLKAVSGQKDLTEDRDYLISEMKRLISISDGAFQTVVFVDKNYKTTDAKGRSHSLADRDFIKDPRWYTAEYNITPAHMGRSTSKSTVGVGVPLKDENGEWYGTIAASISLEYLSQRLSSIKLVKGSYAWLTEASGWVIAHPNPEYISQANIYTSEDLGFIGLPQIGHDTKTHTSGFGEYYDRNTNTQKIATFSSVMFVPGWTLFVTTGKSEIYKEIDTIMVNILVTALFLLGFFLMIVARLTDEVTRPIVNLTRTIKESVNNRYQAIEVLASKDEIGQLSRAFSGTIQQIQNHTHNLEELVEQRTQELNQVNQELEKTNSLLSNKNQTLENLASTDSLTNLYNRRAFNLIAEKEMVRANYSSSPLSLLIMDIDHFKQINDTFGHDVGDTVLTRLAHLLKKHFGSHGVICRWGGEEFVILLSNTDSLSALNRANEIREVISNEHFSPVEALTVSAGVASYKDGESLREWTHNADLALYKAKSAGRNCVKLA